MERDFIADRTKKPFRSEADTSIDFQTNEIVFRIDIRSLCVTLTQSQITRPDSSPHDSIRLIVLRYVTSETRNADYQRPSDDSHKLKQTHVFSTNVRPARLLARVLKPYSHRSIPFIQNTKKKSSENKSTYNIRGKIHAPTTFVFMEPQRRSHLPC